MRFLITTMPRHPIPPEIGLGLVAAMKAFSEKYRDKTEQSWSFAGLAGGGAILNVDSHEELDKIMGEFPFGPFSKVKIRAMSDLATSLDDAARRLEAMVQSTR
jgi:muconolactone delta-isomerase